MILMAWCTSTLAAKVHLINGEDLTGKIAHEDDLSITLQVGTVTVPLLKSEIVSIVDDEGNVRILNRSKPPSQPLPLTAQPVEGGVGEVPSAPALLTLPAAGPVEPLLPILLPRGKTRSIKTGMLNVRKGPSTDFEKISALREGAVVTELQRQGSWLQVRLADGSTGWIHGKYAGDLLDTPVVCTGERVNFRLEPGLNGKILRKLRSEEVLLMLQQKGDWVQLRDSENLVGWASGNYLARVENVLALRPTYTLLSSSTEDKVLMETTEPVAGTGAFSVFLKVPDSRWIKEGKLALVFLAPQADPGVWEALVQGKDVVRGFSAYGPKASRILGLDPTLVGEADSIQLVVLRGRLQEQTWSFQYRLAHPEIPGLRRLLVGQGQERRGVIYEF